MTYQPEQVIPLCPHCQAELIKKTKEGREYYACPNWKPQNKGCKGYFWSPDKEPQKLKPQTVRPEQPDPMLLIFDELRAINERLTKLGEFLVEKFGEIMKKLGD